VFPAAYTDIPGLSVDIVTQKSYLEVWSICSVQIAGVQKGARTLNFLDGIEMWWNCLVAPGCDETHHFGVGSICKGDTPDIYATQAYGLGMVAKGTHTVKVKGKYVTGVGPYISGTNAMLSVKEYPR